MSEETLPERKDKEDWDAIYEIERRLYKYVPGPLRWIGKQSSGEDDWCIAIGEDAACFTLDDRARQMDDEFIREMAEQILGFPPDSIPDFERRLKEAKERGTLAREQANRYQNEAIRWDAIEADLFGKLLAATPSGS